MLLRKCKRCGVEKELISKNFQHLVSRGYAYFRGVCRPCFAPDVNKYRKEWVKDNPVKAMLSDARRRAKLDGVPFDLTVEDVVIPDRCPVFGHVLRRSSFGPNWWSPSIDKIKPELGYIRGNVHVISMRANTLKSDATIEELEMLSAYFRRIRS